MSRAKREARSALWNRRRKLRHVDFWSAVLHIRHLGEEGIRIYNRDICGGLYNGHDPTHELATQRRQMKQELISIEAQIQALKCKQFRMEERRNILRTSLSLKR